MNIKYPYSLMLRPQLVKDKIMMDGTDKLDIYCEPKQEIREASRNKLRKKMFFLGWLRDWFVFKLECQTEQNNMLL